MLAKGSAMHLGRARAALRAQHPRELFEVSRQANATLTSTFMIAKLPLNTMAPKAQISHLHRADGSATYSYKAYSIIGSVNGPIEVQRRDEMPEEATVEVNIRPAFGVGSKYAQYFHF
jgi:hypothetical protein